jgi:hypothetical protein
MEGEEKLHLQQYHIIRIQILNLLIKKPCYVGPCHHSTACPPVADGRDGLQKSGG